MFFKSLNNNMVFLGFLGSLHDFPACSSIVYCLDFMVFLLGFPKFIRFLSMVFL